MRLRPRFLAGAAILSITLCAPLSYGAADAETWLARARSDAAEEHFGPALAAVDSALAGSPGHFEARVLQAKIFSWQGRFDEAESAIRALLKEKPGDPDATLSLAYIRYYQGRLDRAETGFRELLASNPDYADARSGLEAVLRARAAPPLRRWRMDAGGEYSAFARRSQPAWNQQYAQLARVLDDGSMLYGRFELYRQFEMSDVAVEAGISRAFFPRLRGSFAAGWTIDPDFRPDWKLAAEAEGLVLPKPSAPGIPAMWILAGARYDVYEAVEVGGIHPGLRFEWGEPWALAARLNRVQEIGGTALYGWTARVDGPVPAPEHYSLRFWAGASDAPETVRAATVSTRTVFGGLGAARGQWLFNMGYARDDREGSWIRHALSAGAARKF